MKKSIILILAILTISCVTLPDPSKTTKGLLVIPLELENRDSIDLFGQYRITIENMESKEVISHRIPPSNGMSKIYLEPGVYKLSKVEFVYEDAGVHNTTVRKHNHIFKIIHGKVNVFFKTFVTKAYKGDNDSIWMNRELISTTKAKRQEITLKIQSMENGELWEY